VTLIYTPAHAFGLSQHRYFPHLSSTLLTPRACIATLWPDTPGSARLFGAIQHWGMNDALDAVDVGRAYPRLDMWRRIRRQLNQGGTITTFDSDFTRRCGLSDPPLLSVATDFDNDGKDDFAVWRSSTATWFVIDSSTGKTRTQPLGKAGDIPVPGDYSGDGATDFALWQPDSGNWLILDSKTGKTGSAPGGETGDIPVPGRYRGGSLAVAPSGARSTAPGCCSVRERCRRSGVSSATSQCRATTTATAGRTSRCGARARASGI
jgi:hypothetical protein